METIRKFTYKSDKVSAGGGCEAAVTARTRCLWVKFMECDLLLYGRRFPVKGLLMRVMKGQQNCMEV